MATVNWTLGTKRKDGSYPVVIKVSHKGERKKYTSNIVVYLGEYGKVGGVLKVKDKRRQQEINSKVNELQQKVFDYCRKHAGLDVTVEDLVDHLTGKRDKNGGIDFFVFADEYLAKSSIKGKKNYQTMLNSLESHLGKRKLSFSDITYAMLDDYAHSLDDKPRAKTLYLGAIRHLHNEARRRYNTDTEMLISVTIFDRFRVPRQQQKGQRALSVEDFMRIKDYQGKGRAALARDCFMLSFMLMGMNSADLYDNDAKIVDGKICYHRKKVRDRRQDKAYIEVDIPEEAKELMQKYAGKKRVFKFSEMYSDESTFNKALNIGLRKIKEELKLDGLQFYQARHTWASIARNECSIDAYTVDKALNHIPKDMQLLDVYVKKDFRLINEANRKVLEYVKNLTNQ